MSLKQIKMDKRLFLKLGWFCLEFDKTFNTSTLKCIIFTIMITKLKLIPSRFLDAMSSNIGLLFSHPFE